MVIFIEKYKPKIKWNPHITVKGKCRRNQDNIITEVQIVNSKVNTMQVAVFIQSKNP